jgi:hypothetical protein
MCPNYGWAMSSRACHKDKILIDIILPESNVPVPDVFYVSAHEVSKCESPGNRCQVLGKLVGEIWIETKKREIPKQIEIDISSMRICPFLIRIDAQGSSRSWFVAHLGNSSPAISGRSYSVFAENVNIVVKRGRQPF